VATFTAQGVGRPVARQLVVMRRSLVVLDTDIAVAQGIAGVLVRL
jgi:hypothetical protein